MNAPPVAGAPARACQLSEIARFSPGLRAEAKQPGTPEETAYSDRSFLSVSSAHAAAPRPIRPPSTISRPNNRASMRCQGSRTCVEAGGRRRGRHGRYGRRGRLSRFIRVGLFRGKIMVRFSCASRGVRASRPDSVIVLPLLWVRTVLLDCLHRFGV